MKKIKDYTKIGMIILICLILTEFIITILYTNQYFVKFGLDADFATDSVYAKFLAKTGGILLSDDWYPSTELYIVHHQLIMTPLFHIFDDYNTVYTITTAIAFVAVALVIYYFMRSFTDSKLKRLLAVLLVCNPINVLFILFTITFHGYLFYVIFGALYVTILFKLLYKKINRLETVTLLLISFLSGICGIRMFFVLFVPLIFLLFWKYRNLHLDSEFWKHNLKEERFLKNKKVWIIVVSYLLALLGFLIFYCFLMPKYGGADKLEVIGTSNNNIANNVKDIVLMCLNGVGFNVQETKLLSVSFIKASILLLFWIYIFIQNIKLAFQKINHKILKDISLYNIICLLITVLFMVVTLNNYDMSFLLTFRYIGLATYLMIPTAIIGLKKDNTLKSIGIYLIIFLAIFVGLDSHFDAIKISKNLKNDREGYIKFLDESEYSFGAATYWNANLTTFLSEKEIEIKPALSATDIGMYQWNTRKSYQNKQPEFFILTKNEYEERRQKKMEDKIVYEDEWYIVIDLKQH